MLEVTDDVLPRTLAGASVQASWVSSIRSIDKAAWTACFAEQDVMQSYELHAAVEAAQLERVEFHYLLARHAGETVAIIPCFRFRVSLTVLAHRFVSRLVDRLRKLWPGFLHLNVFIIGTPIAICKDLLGFHMRLNQPARRELMRVLLPEVISTAQRVGARLVLLKEITSKQLPERRRLLEDRFVIVEGAATSYLYLGEPGVSTYRERLRKRYRSLMNNRQARFVKEGMRWEVCTDFTPYAEQMHKLYLQVLENSKIRFETLTVRFFTCLPSFLQQNAFALLCFRGEDLVAFELFVGDSQWIHPIYLGMDYRYRDAAALYFNGIYKIIEVLEARGKSVVQLGQTSYDVKASMGAVVDRLHLAAHHTNPVGNWLLKHCAALMFPRTRIPRSQRVFRDMEENDAALVRHGVHFERVES